MNDIPFLIMTMGLSGSGKSTLARHVWIEDDNISIRDDANDTGNPVVHSSDELRAEMFGDATEQGHNDALFVELHRRIKRDLSSGKSVIYDATNLNKKRRKAFLDELRHIQCRKVCMAVLTPYEDCLTNNANRERHVPEDVIHRQWMNWQPPHYHEGFDIVFLAILRGTDVEYDVLTHDLSAYFEKMRSFDQENSHHSLTLGDHCYGAYEYAKQNAPDNPKLHIAAYLHDIGKLYTKTRTNRSGVEDGNCHYYNHQCVGAYIAASILGGAGYPVSDLLDIVNIIYFHMHPYISWKQSDKSLSRDRLMIGDELYNDIMLLHEADVAAH